MLPPPSLSLFSDLLLQQQRSKAAPTIESLSPLSAASSSPSLLLSYLAASSSCTETANSRRKLPAPAPPIGETHQRVEAAAIGVAPTSSSVKQPARRITPTGESSLQRQQPLARTTSNGHLQLLRTATRQQPAQAAFSTDKLWSAASSTEK
ncbi:hypothetical protein KY285_026761 [Solanum tuberosum]|nr:hypothetical protein KY285_026761 [Solanum tuberosum]